MNASAKRETAIDLHLIPLEAPSEVELQCREILSAEEIARADRYRSTTARREFVVSHAALRCLLAGYCDCAPTDLQYEYGPHGKPSLLTSRDLSDLQFNLSHSRGLAAIAVTRSGRIGVDIEGNRNVQSPESLAKSILAEREVEEYENLAVTERETFLLRSWTLKEAFLKAVGVGLSVNASEVVLDGVLSASPKLLVTGMTEEHASHWRLTFPIAKAGHTLAIARDDLGGELQVTNHNFQSWNSFVKSSKNV